MQPRLINATVQCVWAVGEPPEDKLCFFSGLKDVVVLLAVGTYGTCEYRVLFYRRIGFCR